MSLPAPYRAPRGSLAAAIALGASLGTASIDAHAGAVIFNSTDPFFQTVALGVNDEGHLNFGPGVSQNAGDVVLDDDLNFVSGSTGLALNFGDAVNRNFRDATSPGCLCEGWGVAVTLGSADSDNRVAGFANVEAGTGGLTGGTFGATITSATSTISLADAPLRVVHTYGVSLDRNTFQGNITLTNTGSDTLFDVVYRRAMDWDVPPTEFNELVTHVGIEANLEANGGNVRFASNNGFASSDPRIDAGGSAGTINTDFTDNGPNDHGSVFDFAFGNLAPGASRTFNIFYGAYESEARALAAIATLQPTIYSLGQPNHNSGDDGGDGGGGCEVECEEAPTVIAAVTEGFGSDGSPTFLFGFGGVGGVEPGLSPFSPILPFVPAPGQFFFDAPVPRRWFDPPFAFGFEYTLDSGEFLSAMTPDLVGPLTLRVRGMDYTIVPMDEFVFADFGLDDVTSFMIFGTGPDFDAGLVDALPTFLDFTPGSDGLRMIAILTDPNPTEVPAPAALLLLVVGIAGLGLRRRVH